MSCLSINQPRIVEHFSHCTDPRTRPVQYPLIEIIITVMLAVLCGEEGWEAFFDWGEDKLTFLRTFLPFKNGIASPDTLRRVMERVDSTQFLSGFIGWAKEIKERADDQICIDGKVLRRAMADKGPLHLVSAWSEANRMGLGAVKTDAKSNEIPAIEELLDLLVPKKGDVISVDAIGCQKAIVSKITAQKADYVIALKNNQKGLAAEVENFFNQVLNAPEYAPCQGCGVWQGKADRSEIWVCCGNDLEWLPQLKGWSGLKSIVMVKRSWKRNGKHHHERRYYISSLEAPAPEFSHKIRRHWSIENELHWQLDVTFREDDSQIGALANENLRVARMTALEMLRAEKTCKRGLKVKMRKCARSDDYLIKVLNSGKF